MHLRTHPTSLIRDCADFPRRYLANDEGHRVIIGLTLDETSEFEALDTYQSDPQPIDPDEGRRKVGMKRWLELYAKHTVAWDAWIRESKLNQESNGPPAL